MHQEKGEASVASSTMHSVQAGAIEAVIGFDPQCLSALLGLKG